VTPARRHPRLWQGVWGAMILAVVVGSLLPARELPTPWFPGFDKVEHFSGYVVLSAYAVMLFSSARGQLRACCGLVALGIAIEIAQGLFTTTRSADALDALTNAAGVAAGALVRITPLVRTLDWMDRRLFVGG